MNITRGLPYSDERLSYIMGLEPSELKFLPIRDEIKKIVREYNMFMKPDVAISELKKLKDGCALNSMSYDAVTKLISCIKLR